jgi:hypothetical protein
MLLSVETRLGELKDMIIHFDLTPSKGMHVLIDLRVIFAGAYNDRLGKFSEVMRDKRILHTSFRDLPEQNPPDGLGCFQISVHDTLLLPASSPGR